MYLWKRRCSGETACLRRIFKRGREVNGLYENVADKCADTRRGHLGAGYSGGLPTTEYSWKTLRKASKSSLQPSTMKIASSVDAKLPREICWDMDSIYSVTSASIFAASSDCWSETGISQVTESMEILHYFIILIRDFASGTFDRRGCTMFVIRRNIMRDWEASIVFEQGVASCWREVVSTSSLFRGEDIYHEWELAFGELSEKFVCSYYMVGCAPLSIWNSRSLFALFAIKETTRIGCSLSTTIWSDWELLEGMLVKLETAFALTQFIRCPQSSTALHSVS